MKLRWLMLSVVVGWGVALGCSDEEPTAPGGEAGGAGAPVVPVGEGGTGGGGAEPAGGGGGVASCEAEPLECDDCPTLEELRDDCATIYRVSCDRLLVVPRPASPTNLYEYCFDVQGGLIGTVEEVDVPYVRTVTGADCGARSEHVERGCLGGAGGEAVAGGAGGVGDAAGAGGALR